MDVSFWLQHIKCLLIAFISVTISESDLAEIIDLRTSIHSCNIWWSGSPKQAIIVSLICPLFFPTTVMEFKSYASKASSLTLTVSDLMRILWHALTWRKIYNRKKNKVWIFILKKKCIWLEKISLGRIWRNHLEPIGRLLLHLPCKWTLSISTVSNRTG